MTPWIVNKYKLFFFALEKKVVKRLGPDLLNVSVCKITDLHNTHTKLKNKNTENAELCLAYELNFAHVYFSL